MVCSVCGDVTLSRVQPHTLTTAYSLVDHVMIDGPDASFAAHTFGEYVVSQVLALKALSSVRMVSFLLCDC